MSCRSKKEPNRFRSSRPRSGLVECDLNRAALPFRKTPFRKYFKQRFSRSFVLFGPDGSRKLLDCRAVADRPYSSEPQIGHFCPKPEGDHGGVNLCVSAPCFALDAARTAGSKGSRN